MSVKLATTPLGVPCLKNTTIMVSRAVYLRGSYIPYLRSFVVPWLPECLTGVAGSAKAYESLHTRYVCR